MRSNYTEWVSVLIVLYTVSHIAECCPEMMSRKDWRAKAPKEKAPIPEPPVTYVVIHHTYIPGFCNTTKQCKSSMRAMQSVHQDTHGWGDIGYNFCIGGDGKIYEGRGWGVVGAHAPVYNFKSVGICFIGDFRTELPTKEMLDAAHELIECGIDEGHLDENYDLVGHKQVRRTECPGDALYNHIKTWPHWTDQGVRIIERTPAEKIREEIDRRWPRDDPEEDNERKTTTPKHLEPYDKDNGKWD